MVSAGVKPVKRKREKKRNPANGECEVAECTREGQKINAGANSCICKKVEENGKCWSKACDTAEGEERQPDGSCKSLNEISCIGSEVRWNGNNCICKDEKLPICVLRR